MIGLAILYWLCDHITELKVGENVFYEELPIDYTTGAMERYGVYLTTESAPLQQSGDKHQYLTFYVAIGEGAVDAAGQPVAEKYETDRLLDAIQALISDGLSHYGELCKLTVPNTALVYSDIRLLPSASRVRGVTLTNGAIVKSLTAEVFYK